MIHARIRAIIRQFPQNGLKLLLENPANMRDLLSLAHSTIVDRLDFERMKLVRTSFVGRDYRQRESDLVVTVPLRRRTGSRSGGAVTLYILLEHQSEPEWLMPLRLNDYLTQIWKPQAREWQQQRGTRTRVRLQPI